MAGRRGGRRRRWPAVLAGLALLAGLAAAVRWGPAAALALTLAMPASERWLGAGPAPEPLRVAVAGGDLDADLYRPVSPRGALVLVHGLSRHGRRHPELQRLARLLAARGQLVVVPELPGLTAFRLGGREVDEVAATIGHARRSGLPTGVAGFSFGAGPALLAAAEHPGLRVVGAFGGYADLRHVITFITTGVHGWQGRRHVETQLDYNRWKLLALLAGFVEPPPDRQRLDAIAARRLDDPGADTGALAAALGPAGRAVLALVTNRREERVAELLAALPAAARAGLDRLSVVAAVTRLSAPLLLAHGAADDSIPYTESLRLAAAAPGRSRLVLLRTFHHTGPRGLWRSVLDGAADALGLVRLADGLLAGG